MKKRILLEYTLNSSPKVLYPRLSTPGGLAEWFADDVKVYVVLNKTASSSLLQSGLDKLSVWANDWRLQISIPKCSVLHIGNNSNVAVYNINGNVLPNVTAMRDLGVS